MGYNGKKVCIVGAGGFGRETFCCLLDEMAGSGLNPADMACFMVLDEDLTERKIMGIDVILHSEFDPALYDVVVAIGDPATRKKVVDKMPVETTYATIIHPSAVISDWVKLEPGAIVTAGTILTCNINIGKHAHLNLYTTIGHDCEMGDYFTTAPAANISGECKFADCVYFGTNTSVRQGVSICSNVTIGMGAVVVKNITEPGVYIGNPLRKLEK